MIHPLVVHFPIVLLFLAGGLYIYGIVKSRENETKFAALCHILGIVSLIVAILTGQQAESQTIHTKELHTMIERHGLLSWVTIWSFGLMYVWQLLRAKKFVTLEKYGFLVIFCMLLGVMGYSAHLGGEMVYEKGAGVEPYKPQLEQIFQNEQK